MRRYTDVVEVVEKKGGRIVLKLRSRAIPPWDYEATQVISLAGATLEMELGLKHFGVRPIPYGLGQHPWFVRTPGVKLQAKASGMWLEQPPEFLHPYKSSWYLHHATTETLDALRRQFTDAGLQVSVIYSSARKLLDNLQAEGWRLENADGSECPLDDYRAALAPRR